MVRTFSMVPYLQLCMFLLAALAIILHVCEKEHVLQMGKELLVMFSIDIYL